MREQHNPPKTQKKRSDLSDPLLSPIVVGLERTANWVTPLVLQCTGPGAKNFYVKGSHRPRPLTRLRRSLIDKTPPITLIRTRRMRIDELVCIMAVGDCWRSFLLFFFYWVSNHRDEIKCALVLLCTQYYSQYREFPHQRHGIKCAPSWEENTKSTVWMFIYFLKQHQHYM